ncbi:MAG: hypothetical protein KGI29_09710 [Pseudomonadota bacterium]|nr:hypothetical protein [Pseudomonadota bacterium]MDE3037720.1 hypothetical protein [Pseudomonadota bacterium]
MELSTALKDKIAKSENTTGLLQALETAQDPSARLRTLVALDCGVQNPDPDPVAGILKDYSTRPSVHITPGPIGSVALLTSGTVQDYIDILSDLRVMGISAPDVQIARGGLER